MKPATSYRSFNAHNTVLIASSILTLCAFSSCQTARNTSADAVTPTSTSTTVAGPVINTGGTPGGTQPAQPGGPVTQASGYQTFQTWCMAQQQANKAPDQAMPTTVTQAAADLIQEDANWYADQTTNNQEEFDTTTAAGNNAAQATLCQDLFWDNGAMKRFPDATGTAIQSLSAQINQTAIDFDVPAVYIGCALAGQLVIPDSSNMSPTPTLLDLVSDNSFRDARFFIEYNHLMTAKLRKSIAPYKLQDIAKVTTTKDVSADSILQIALISKIAAIGITVKREYMEAYGQKDLNFNQGREPQILATVFNAGINLHTDADPKNGQPTLSSFGLFCARYKNDIQLLLK